MLVDGTEISLRLQAFAQLLIGQMNISLVISPLVSVADLIQKTTPLVLARLLVAYWTDPC